MIYKFTVSSEKVLQIAKDIASGLGHNYIGTEHILYGLAKENNGVARKSFKKTKHYSRGYFRENSRFNRK